MRKATEVQRAIKSRRVFVLDGDEINRTVLQFMLEGDNETYQFTSVGSALKRGLRLRPDVVLISALLVAHEGRELLHKLRVTWPDVKLVVICEAADEECEAAALAAGADDCLARPFMLEPVRRKVEHHFVPGIEPRIAPIAGPELLLHASKPGNLQTTH